MTIYRRRGVAIIESKNGILVVEERDGKFSLPGGGAKLWESRKRATVRELYEETGLTTKKISYLFSYIGHLWHNHRRESVRNKTKVFLVKTEGIPKAKHEINSINFWKPRSKLNISNGTKEVIEKYLNNYS
jgi:8-oxo-dGTP pyrophosphatase MutT (NUDIX family)